MDKSRHNLLAEGELFLLNKGFKKIRSEYNSFEVFGTTTIHGYLEFTLLGDGAGVASSIWLNSDKDTERAILYGMKICNTEDLIYLFNKNIFLIEVG